PSHVGESCAHDTDCGPNGVCLGGGSNRTGICVVRATEPCPSAGSPDGCPADARCWTSGAGDSLCWADCDKSCGSAGTCDSDGSCVPSMPDTGDGSGGASGTGGARATSGSGGSRGSSSRSCTCSCLCS